MARIFIGGTGSSIQTQIDFERMFGGFDDEIFSIVLTHEPDNTIEILQHRTPNLILAGHSHGGQIRLPFLRNFYNVRGAITYREEHYEFTGGQLFVSFGVGTTTQPFRMFNKPSINFYRVNAK